MMCDGSPSALVLSTWQGWLYMAIVLKEPRGRSSYVTTVPAINHRGGKITS